jgi:hypothetical protein
LLSNHAGSIGASPRFSAGLQADIPRLLRLGASGSGRSLARSLDR